MPSTAVTRHRFPRALPALLGSVVALVLLAAAPVRAQDTGPAPEGTSGGTEGAASAGGAVGGVGTAVGNATSNIGSLVTNTVMQAVGTTQGGGP